MMTEKERIYHARFKDAPWYKPNVKTIICTIGGVGGIGSWLSLLLGRSGYNLQIWDLDTVDEVNMGGQLYAEEHIGDPKVLAVKDILKNLSPLTKIHFVNDRMTEETLRTTVPTSSIFSCFDHMEPRYMLSEYWHTRCLPLDTEYNPSIFIDGRMEAESAMIYCVTDEGSYQKYRSELFEDDKVPDAPCSFRATSHMPAILAGYMTALFNNFITNKTAGEQIREVPYKMEIELPTFTFTSKRLEELNTIAS